MVKQNFQQPSSSLVISLVSHDPSEIILIWRFKKHALLLSMHAENSCAA